MTLNAALFPRIDPVAVDRPRPFWSVVIPAYNRPDYLAHCLHSVLAQAPGPDQMQILVVDDCSPTPLATIVQQIGNGRVEYYRNAQNLLNSATFNVGVQRAIGHWIHLLHDDDWVLPGFYATLQPALTAHPDVGAACCRFAQTDPTGHWMQESEAFRQGAGVLSNWLEKIAIDNPLSPPAVVIRRAAYERLGGYHPGIACGEDWELYKRVSVFYDWWYQPEILACYRQHPNNITTNFTKVAKRNQELHRTIELAETYLPAAVREDLTARARCHYAVVAFKHALHLLQCQEPVLALRSVQDGLNLSRDERVYYTLFAQLLLDAAADPLRQQIVDMLLSAAIAPDQPSHPPAP